MNRPKKRNTIVVSDIPDKLFKKISDKAKTNRRSKGNEVLTILIKEYETV